MDNLTSLYDWTRAMELFQADEPFYALILAAMLKADTTNIEKLAAIFPRVNAECHKRYNAPGGRLPGEEA